MVFTASILGRWTKPHSSEISLYFCFLWIMDRNSLKWGAKISVTEMQHADVDTG